MSATGPAAVEACPVCGSPMARGERFRVQVLREAPVTWRSRTSWTWQMVGSTLACPGCAGAVGELLRRMGGEMVSEAVKHLGHARREVDEAIGDLTGGRVEDGALACARAVEELLEALHELAWSACDRALYGEDGEECPGH